MKKKKEKNNLKLKFQLKFEGMVKLNLSQVKRSILRCIFLLILLLFAKGKNLLLVILIIKAPH